MSDKKTKRQSSFEQTRWSKSDSVKEYLKHADALLPERKSFRRVLRAFFTHYFKGKEQAAVLELGCGDGVMTESLLTLGVPLKATLIDASDEMLEGARKRLCTHKGITFIKATFEDILKGTVELEDFDLAYSSLALHHLTSEERSRLFRLLYTHTNEGGAIVNMDTCLAPSPSLEEFYFKLRREDALEEAAGLGLEDCIENFNKRHKEPIHHERLDTLVTQLNALTEAGFKDADCYYKNGTFAAFGARKVIED